MARAGEARIPVKLAAIHNERHYKAMTEFMNELLDEMGERESHPLMELLDVVTILVSDYEDKHKKLPEASPADVLRFLMEQNQPSWTTDSPDRVSAPMRSISGQGSFSWGLPLGARAL